MPKHVYAIILVIASSAASLAQCVVDPQYTQPGFYGSACFLGDGSFNSRQTIQFVNFDSISVGNNRMKVDYLIVDSVLNLPCGIVWETDKLQAKGSNRFENQERGCIDFWGVTDDTVGQYRLAVKFLVKLSGVALEVPMHDTMLQLRLDAVVRGNSCTDCPVVDTSSQVTLRRASCGPSESELYTDYCMIPSNCYPLPCTGVNEITTIQHFRFYPNPTNNTATVSFTADKAATYVARIVNIYGAEVSREQLNVASGLNVNNINVSNLANGVYLYLISDGKNVQTQRFVVGR